MSSTQGTSRPLSTAEGFVCGSIAACIAVSHRQIAPRRFFDINEQVTFSNPPEVAKTRLQLQGELAKSGGQKVYKNAIDVLAKTWKNEGIRGLQRGLGAAVSSPCTFVVSSSHFSSMYTR